MGAGICVLTSDIPENCEVVEDAGFTFRRGDVCDLERMLRMLLTDPQIRKAAGHCARERVRKSYLWPQIAADIERVYSGLAGRNRISATIEAAGTVANPGKKERHRAA
jgi:glycosyltransferase involved in cell wall biosynthesis